MSNPVKSLKKNFKKIVKVAAVAAVVYFAAPAIASALGVGGGAAAGGAASGMGSIPGAVGAGMSGGGALVSAGNTAAAAAGGGGGFLGALGAGAAKVGGAIGGMSPVAQAALIQTGGQMLAGAMTPEPESQSDLMRQQQSMAFGRGIAPVGAPQQQQAQPGGYLGQMPAGLQPSGAFTTPQPFRPAIQMGANQAQVQMPMQSDAGGRFNPMTGMWENAG